MYKDLTEYEALELIAKVSTNLENTHITGAEPTDKLFSYEDIENVCFNLLEHLDLIRE